MLGCVVVMRYPVSPDPWVAKLKALVVSLSLPVPTWSRWGIAVCAPLPAGGKQIEVAGRLAEVETREKLCSWCS